MSTVARQLFAISALGFSSDERTFHPEGARPVAMAQARAAAGSGIISIAGGATTINEHLAAGLIDELRLHVVPYTAGVSRGSRIFDGIPCVDFEVVSARHTPYVTHLTYRRRDWALGSRGCHVPIRRSVTRWRRVGG